MTRRKNAGPRQSPGAGARKAPSRKPGAKKSSKPAAKRGTKKTVGTPAARKSAAKKVATKKASVKKTGAKKAGSKKTGAKKAGAKRAGAGTRQGSPSGRPRKPAPARAFKVTPMPVVIESDGKERLNKFLASAGICSRRAADALIESGRVQINKDTVRTLGTRIDPIRDDVRVDGQRVVQEKKVYLLFNKPRGVVCTNARNEQRQRVIDFLEHIKGRIYTIGRLDADSEGLILLTNDGDFAQEMAHPKYGVPKTYAVLVRGHVETDVLKKARGGVWLAEGRTSGAMIKVERRSRDRSYLKVTLREGKNREIRRVFARLGNPVLTLKRVRIGGLNLHGLRSGSHRFLRPEEIEGLRQIAREEMQVTDAS